MRRLGYTRYVAQGGDQGAAVPDAMGAQAPEGLLGIHLNFLRQAVGSVSGLPADSEAERAALAALSTFRTSGSGYFMEQATRPQTIGYALLDSPVALAAWMLDHDTEATAKSPAPLAAGSDGSTPTSFISARPTKAATSRPGRSRNCFRHEIRRDVPSAISCRYCRRGGGRPSAPRRGVAGARAGTLEGELSWSFVACHAAHDLWDDEGWYDLSARYLQLARNVGALAALPLALAQRVGVLLHAGDSARPPRSSRRPPSSARNRRTGRCP